MAFELARLKGAEILLRLELVDQFWPTRGIGTKTVEVGGGHLLAATFKMNYGLAAEDKTRPVLEKMAAADPAGPELVKRLVVWKPELRVGEYNKLPPKLRKMIDSVLTISPATPSLELRAPK